MRVPHISTPDREEEPGYGEAARLNDEIEDRRQAFNDLYNKIVESVRRRHPGYVTHALDRIIEDIEEEHAR